MTSAVMGEHVRTGLKLSPQHQKLRTLGFCEDCVRPLARQTLSCQVDDVGKGNQVELQLRIAFPRSRVQVPYALWRRAATHSSKLAPITVEGVSRAFSAQ